jgi:cell division control protein 6
VRIIQDRIGNTIVPLQALQFIAKKVANTSGDARKALELTAGAVKECLEALQMDHTKPSASGSLVTMRHVQSTVKRFNRNVAEIISGLPSVAKVILCVTITLAKAQVTTTTVGKLRGFVRDCMMKDRPEDMVSMEDFIILLETLADSGVLSFGKVASKVASVSQMDITEMPIRLGVQLDEVESALEKELCRDSPYFAELCDYVSRNRHLLQPRSN